MSAKQLARARSQVLPERPAKYWRIRTANLRQRIRGNHTMIRPFTSPNPEPAMSPRHGWTRADALATFVMLVLLGGLLMPAPARTEPAANRSKTTNNLKMIGLAFQNHND